MDLAKSQSSDNPVTYVQYAHARIHAVLCQAAAVVDVEPSDGTINPNAWSRPTNWTCSAVALPGGGRGCCGNEEPIS